MVISLFRIDFSAHFGLYWLFRSQIGALLEKLIFEVLRCWGSLTGSQQAFAYKFQPFGWKTTCRKIYVFKVNFWCWIEFRGQKWLLRHITWSYGHVWVKKTKWAKMTFFSPNVAIWPSYGSQKSLLTSEFDSASKIDPENIYVKTPKCPKTPFSATFRFLSIFQDFWKSRFWRFLEGSTSAVCGPFELKIVWGLCLALKSSHINFQLKRTAHDEVTDLAKTPFWPSKGTTCEFCQNQNTL